LVVDEIKLKQLTAMGDNLTITGNTIVFDNVVSFNNLINISGGLGFSQFQLDVTSLNQGKGYLYLDKGDLMFQKPSSVDTLNLTEAFSGTANTILVLMKMEV